MTAQKPDRLLSIELLRIVAAFGIVWFHVGAPGADLGYGGLPAFLIVAVAFAAAPPRAGAPRQTVVARLRRLGVPWLFWCLVYGAAKAARALAAHTPWSETFQPPMLLYGTAIHLWYLPFAMVVTVLVGLAVGRGLPVRTAGFRRAMLLAAGGAIVGASALDGRIAAEPFAQWVFVSPFVFLGLVFASIPIGQPTTGPRLLAVLGVVAVACAVAAWWCPGPCLVPYSSGTAACALAWSFSRPVGPVVLRLAALSFGVYLAHPLVHSVLTRVLSETSTPVRAVLVFVVSAGCARLLVATRLRAFV